MAKTKDMILAEGKWVCPLCMKRKFREIKEANSYPTYIKDHDVVDGKFKFVYICDNCGINLVEYDEMKKR